MNDPGTLYVIATPIGNLEDITFRALKVLKEVDVLACEDTRQTSKLYNHFELDKPDIRLPYHEHNERKMEEKLLELLREGKSIALCSDAGYPGISDPGYRIISRVAEEGLPLEVIPGASAVPLALLHSGLPSSSYLFKGFPPRKSGQRQRFLGEEADKPHTMVLYESPYRIGALLEDALAALGNRKAAVCLELTKKFQRIYRGTLEELAAQFKDRKEKGEITVVIAGNNPKFKETTGEPEEEETD